MNVLVIGNGFDLAHGLSTKYSDFLHFIMLFNQKTSILGYMNYKPSKCNQKQIDYIDNLFNTREKMNTQIRL